MKVGASHTPSQTLLPLTSRSPTPHRWVPSHSPTVSCAYRAAGWRQPLPTRSPSMPSSARAAAPACRRAEALEVRYRAAGGVGEEAHSRQRHWCPWSKPMNVETCADVADLIVMAHAFAELRDGVVARQHEKRFELASNLNIPLLWANCSPLPWATLYSTLGSTLGYSLLMFQKRTHSSRHYVTFDGAKRRHGSWPRRSRPS